MKLEDVAKEILAELKDHPTFDNELFEDRDYEGLIEVGGDVATITTWAIMLADALQE